MTTKSNLLLAVLTFFGCFVLLAMRPVPATAVHNVKSITGKITNVSGDDTSGEVLIRLENDRRIYYFNRGAQHKIPLQILKNNILYRSATLKFTKQCSPSISNKQSVPVARLNVAGQTFWQQPTARFVTN